MDEIVMKIGPVSIQVDAPSLITIAQLEDALGALGHVGLTLSTVEETGGGYRSAVFLRN